MINYSSDINTCTATIVLYYNASDVYKNNLLCLFYSMQVIIKPIIFLLIERLKNFSCPTSLSSFSLLIVQVKTQFCSGIAQYDRCSTNTGCACLHIPGAINVGICSYLSSITVCSELVKCDNNNRCDTTEHLCLHHPKCSSTPVCYPVPADNEQRCPPIPSKRAIS